MVDKVVSKQELIDAQKDAKTLEDVINGEVGQLIKTRLGRMVYTLASIPMINTMPRSEISSLLDQKTDKTYVDASLTAIAGGHKAYATLAAALANTSTFPQNSIVEITNDGANNGTYQWNGADLTKSAYDPLTQAKSYADARDNIVRTDLSYFLPRTTPDFGYLNITTIGEVDLVRKLYVSGTWSQGDVILDNLNKSAGGFFVYFRNPSNTIVGGGDVVETDYTGIKTYTITRSGGFTVKIQIDWSKYAALSSGISKNRYVKDIAHTDFTVAQSSEYTDKQTTQDNKISTAEIDSTYLKTNLTKYLPFTTPDFGYLNITTGGEVDCVRKLYVVSNPDWSVGNVILDYFKKDAGGAKFAIFFRNLSNVILFGGDIAETDYTGIKTYTIPTSDPSKYAGYIQIDWSKYSFLADGITKNRYVKEIAKVDFTITSLDDEHEETQDNRIASLEAIAKPIAIVYKQYINQTITTANFNVSGGWSIGTGTASTTTASETDKLYTKQAYISNKIQHRWTVALKSGSVVKVGGFEGSAYIETTCIIDTVNKKLIINKAGDNSSAATTPRASVNIPFNIVDDREYYIYLFRNNRKNSIKFVDAVTGESVTAVDDWSNVGYTVGSGNLRSLMYITMAAGTSLTVKKYENYLPVNVDVVFGGDSNTESSQDVASKYQMNWADNLMTEVFRENGVKAARFGMTFSMWFACINEILAMKPKYLIVLIGTNSATTQEQYQQIVDICATNSIELILCHNPRDDGSRAYLAQNNLNIDATGVRTVKFDMATSLNYDLAQAYNSSYYKDGVHLNATGYKALSDRFLAEIPMLKSS